MKIEVLRKDSSNWLDYAEKIAEKDWAAADYLAKNMRQGKFADWEAVIIVEEKDRLAGFCSIVKHDIVDTIDYQPYIATVYVDPAFRGQNLSEKIVSYAEKELKKQGFEKIYIVTQLVDFYEKLGYQKIGEANDRFDRKMSVYCKAITNK
ncbi:MULTISPECIES: GNAT family N-acetyltransferase [unclassified Enterococcus]|mgnify:CR=1 FL=1|jgi:N-acetylglutamate synthase-like GNAT family acetyltransferase|uniref:GNAT family N-acetyltransferase n=1 Tax=unclassified Enterococcus TaxID=2608891 RepID=UPI003D2E50A5